MSYIRNIRYSLLMFTAFILALLLVSCSGADNGSVSVQADTPSSNNTDSGNVNNGDVNNSVGNNGETDSNNQNSSPSEPDTPPSIPDKPVVKPNSSSRIVVSPDCSFMYMTRLENRTVDVTVEPGNQNVIVLAQVDDPNILGVEYTGDKFNIMPQKAGSTSITFYDQDNIISKTCNIIVDPIRIKKFIFDNGNNITMYAGTEIALSYTFEPSNADISFNLSSNNTNIVDVKNGQLYAKNAGNAVITASTYDGEILSSINVSVIMPSNITITPNEKELTFSYNAGDKKEIKISDNGSPVNFSFASSSNNFKAVKKDDKTIEITTVENRLSTEVTGTLTIKKDNNIFLKEYKLIQKANPKPTTKILWVKGVDPKNPVTPPGEAATYKEWNETGKDGWFNVLKLKFPVSTGADSNMCWAMASSSILHWWFDQNKDYVAKYEAKTGKKCNTAFHIEYAGKDESKVSDIAATFRAKFPNRSGYTNNGINWFLGHPNRSEYPESPSCVGEIFEGTNRQIVNRTNVFNRKDFSRMLKTALEQGKGIGIDRLQRGGTGHAITLWGAEFDDNDMVVSIYVTDSDIGRHLLFTYGVHDQDGMTYLRKKLYPDIRTEWKIVNMYTVDLAQDLFEAYLKK